MAILIKVFIKMKVVKMTVYAMQSPVIGDGTKQCK
jgi:hypothetical protein